MLIIKCFYAGTIMCRDSAHLLQYYVSVWSSAGEKLSGSKDLQGDTVHVPWQMRVLDCLRCGPLHGASEVNMSIR